MVQKVAKSAPKCERWHRIFWSRLKRSSQSARLRFFCFSGFSAFSGFTVFSVLAFFSFFSLSFLSFLGTCVSSSSGFFSKNFFRFLQPRRVALNLVSWTRVQNWSNSGECENQWVWLAAQRTQVDCSALALALLVLTSAAAALEHLLAASRVYGLGSCDQWDGCLHLMILKIMQGSWTKGRLEKHVQDKYNIHVQLMN